MNGLFGGWVAALMASLVYPVIAFIFPPYKEPDEVILPFTDFQDMASGQVRTFAWGSKPGILKKNADGTLWAFVGVCTHLDCNVTYKPEQKKFFCACHDGWYNEFGKNIAGPPSTPLRRLSIVVEEPDLIIKKEAPE